MKIAVKTLANKEAGSIDLDDDVFGVDVRQDLLHRMVHYQMNKRRSGTRKVKTISEVSGTGKKPYAQKGTGRARAGSLRRPQDVGGGRVHGPVVRSHATDLPKQVRALAMKSALSAKAKSGDLIILEAATASAMKTKAMVAALKTMGIENALFVCGSELDQNFALSVRNIPHIDVLPTDGANVYDILRRTTLVLTKDAVDALTARLNKKAA